MPFGCGWNRVDVTGEVTTDVKLSYSKKGFPIARVRMQSESTHRTGYQLNRLVTETARIWVSFAGKAAEVVAKYLQRGMWLRVEGRIISRPGRGGRGWIFSIRAQVFQFLQGSPVTPPHFVVQQDFWAGEKSEPAEVRQAEPEIWQRA